MCGIAGVVEAPGVAAERAVAVAMAQSIRHRGPDGDGVFVRNNVALSHRRLSIIDIAGGAQPMTSASGRCTTSYNGEIYNYRRLRERLADEGYRFESNSDTEVVLAIYETWGTAGFAQLEGMFAFALYDSERSLLFLVRDPVGIKPLYIGRDGKRTVFASEIKAVIKGLATRPSLDPQSVNGYFLRQYIDGLATIYQGINRLEPGHLLRIDVETGGSRQQRYVEELEQRTPQKLTLGDACAELEQELGRAVEDHLIADVPVGVFLSGGVDSSVLVALAAKRVDAPLRTFSVGFGDSNVDEVRFAGEVARHFKTDHHELRVDGDASLRVMPELFAALDQPLADYAIVPTFAMSQAAVEHVKVVLAGEGADELFAGYPKRYKPLRAVQSLRAGVLSHRMIGPRLFGDKARASLLGSRFIAERQLSVEQAMRDDLKRFSKLGAVNAALRTDMRHWLANDLLMKADKMAMLASLEVRVPYLDHQLINRVSHWHADLKVSLFDTKIVLRELARRHLPKAIVDRKKQGFTVPVGQWLSGPLQASFNDVVSSQQARQWLEPAAVDRLWREHRGGKERGRLLWAIYVFARWLVERG